MLILIAFLGLFSSAFGEAPQVGNIFLEALNFLRPMNPCPSSWTYYNVTGSCYHVFKGMNWKNAEQKCVEEQSHLTSIHSEKEGKFVAQLAAPFSSSYHHWPSQTFIGLFTSDNCLTWQWSDGTPTDYFRWAPDEPSTSNQEYCGQIWSTADDYYIKQGHFNNYKCDSDKSHLASFVCKKLSN